MVDYELAPGAERDLEQIASYTIGTWGVRQARRYAATLEKHFRAIGKGRARSRQFLVHRSNLRVSRCEHHYIFILERDADCRLILAVLHENMNLLNRVRERLEG